MAEPSSYMDPRTSKASTKPDQVKNVKDSNFGSPIQTKNIGLTKNPKQESKADYSGNPKEFIHGNRNKHLSSVYTSGLTHLKKLDLSGRGLTKFPEGLLGCGEVEELNLSNNPLGPSFISPMFRLWNSLKKLDLSGCGLTKFLESSEHFHGLEELNLSNNPLGPSFIFPMLPWLPYGLKKLDLSGCGLTKFPEDFRKYWYRLEELNLSNNPLDPSFIPPMLPWLRHSLKKLDLSGCGLTKFPEDFGKYWYRLEELNLSNNPLGPSFKFPMLPWLQDSLKKLDLSGCGLKEWPCALEKCSSLQELDLSNNSIGHEELLEELNSGKMFISHLSSYKSGKGPFGPMTRIIFEDSVFTQCNGVWTVEAHEDFAIVSNESSMKDVHKREMRLLKDWYTEVSLPNEEFWLDEFRRIRKSEKLTIETYHSMLQSLKIVRNLVSNNVEICQQESTLNRLCCEIQRDLSNITFSRGNLASGYVQQSISYLKSAVAWLKNWSIQADDQYELQQRSMTTCEFAFKKADEAFQKGSYIADQILAAKLKIISKIILNLTKPKPAVVCCLQSLQELHDLQAIREVFSSMNRKEAKTTFLKVDVSFAKFVLKINKILFEFVRVIFKSPPTVEEWPATINTMDEQIYNPLIDGRWLDEMLMDASMAISGEMNLDIGEVDNKV